MRLWDVTEGRLIHAFSDVVQVESDRVGNALAFSPDGLKLAAASDDSTVVVWGLKDYRRLLTLKGHTQQVNAVAYLDEHRLVSGSEDKTIRLWDAETGENVFTLRGHINGVLGVACRPDGKQIASASVDQSFRIWDVEAPSTEALGERREVSAQRDARRAIRHGRPEDALRTLEVLARFRPPSVETMVLRGQALAGLGKQDEAISTYRKVCNLDLNAALPRIELGRALMLKSQYGPAEASLAEAMRLAVETPELDGLELNQALAELGRRLREQHDLEGATRVYHILLNGLEVHFRAHPDHPQADRGYPLYLLTLLGDLSLQRERYSDASGYYHKGVELFQGLTNPGAVDLHNLASCCARSSLLFSRVSRPTDVRHAECEAMALRAMDALRRSIAAGFKDIEHLRQCKALDILRSRTDFQLLMMDMAMPEDPFATW